MFLKMLFEFVIIGIAEGAFFYAEGASVVVGKRHGAFSNLSIFLLL